MEVWMCLMPPSFSPALQTALTSVRSRREKHDWIGPELDQIIELLGELPPEQISRTDKAVAFAGGFHPYPRAPALTQLHRRPRTDHEQLLQTPKLAYFFLFHLDGRLREAALGRLTEGLPSSFLFAAVAWRLNDWAAPVREAAVACAARCFPRTRPDVVARCAVALLMRRLTWGRWNDEYEILDQAFGRPDVAACLADLLISRTTGPVAKLLRAALRTSALDPHLTRVARNAIQPSTRATALDMLINGRASWPARYGWRWLDKSMGERRRIIVYEERNLAVALDRRTLISCGILDTSAAVRRMALNGITRYFKGNREARDYAETLLTD